MSGGHSLSASKVVRVSPFTPTVGISSMEVLHQSAAGWVETSEVHIGEDIRLIASYGVTELAGNFFPPCVFGTLRLLRAGITILSAPAQCPATQPSNSLPYVYVDTRITDASNTGVLTAEFDLHYDEGRYGTAHGSGSITFTVVL